MEKEQNMLTLQEVQTLIPLIDLGVKASGLTLFNDGRHSHAHLHNALAKLQKMAQDSAQAQAQSTKTQVDANGAGTTKVDGGQELPASPAP